MIKNIHKKESDVNYIKQELKNGRKNMKVRRISYLQFLLVVLILPSAHIVRADMYINQNDIVKTDTIYGYLNNDEHIDLITVKTDGNIPPLVNIKIYLNLGDNNYKLFKDKGYVALDNVSIPKIEITEDGDINVMEYHYRFVMVYKYKFFDSQNDWVLYGSELFDKDDDYITPSGVSIWPLFETRLIGTDQEVCIDIVTKNQKDSLMECLNKQYKQFLEEYKIKNYKEILKYKIEDYNTVKRYIGINESNVQQLNDIGFFLCEAGQYKLAVEILEGITAKYYERTVAYINLGDAYWGLDNKNDAKEAYQKYIELMKANGKQSKIPQRIFDRVK